MIEVSLTELNRSDFYQKTLQMIEQICEDYAIEKEFGTLSMANQMVCDYLETNFPQFTADVDCQVDSEGVTMQYSLQGADFTSLSSNADGENTACYVLQTLADEISFSTEYDTLVTTFHVKTKMHIQRSMQRQDVRAHIYR